MISTRLFKSNRKLITYISWSLVTLWMLTIFNLSSQAAQQSNNLSTGVSEAIVEVIEKVAPKYDFDIRELNHLLRKNAHFFSYLVLGVLVINALRRSGNKRMTGYALAFVICVLYAVSDEVHQLFVPGRGGQVTDVLIDSAGAAVGITAYLLVLEIVRISSRGVANGVIYKRTN
ncbi:VanZ family protein [Lutispora sp.]|uniref:VanZ family protein n=1 Tax=Lutispora sp. TaxID=2828727 RepID=UPI003566B3FD